MLTLMFWRATLERSLSTAAQAVLLAIGTDVVEALKVDAFHLNWVRLGSFAVGGALLAVLKAMAAAKISGSGPGFGTSEVLSAPTPKPVPPRPTARHGRRPARRARRRLRRLARRARRRRSPCVTSGSGDTPNSTVTPTQ